VRLSVCSKVHMICLWSSRYHCHPIISCFIKIQNGLTFLVPAYPGCHGKQTVKRVSSSIPFKVIGWEECSDHIDYTISRYRSWIRRAYDIAAAIYRTISCTNARLIYIMHERTSRACAAHILYRSGGVCV